MEKIKIFKGKRLPSVFFWILVIAGAIAGAVLLFTQWGLEWYQENELEWEYGIFSIIFLIIHLIPFTLSVLGGGAVGAAIGFGLASGINWIVDKLLENQVDGLGNKRILTKPRKIALICVAVILVIVSIIVVCKASEKNKIRFEIENYLSSEFGLEDIEIKFTEPYSDVWEYGVVVYSSNLDTLSYEKMTRIEYYLTSHTKLDSGDVVINCYICGEDTYKIYTTSVYKNGSCVYEYKAPPSSSVTSAEVPYYGMSADDVGKTKLGRPDKTEYCKDYSALRPERRSITFKWYDSKGKLMFLAYSYGGKIISTTDYRK